MVANETVGERQENRLVQANQNPTQRNSEWLNFVGFLTTFFAALIVTAALVLFFLVLPITEPPTSLPSKVDPVFNIIPMLPPNVQLNRERLVASSDDFRLQNYVKFAGTSVHSHKYRLLRVSEGNLNGKVYRPPAGHNAVLFIPGHAGHFAQVRSLAKEGSRSNPKFSSVRLSDTPEYYTIDFNGEFSALSDDILKDQAQFVVDCIKTIMDLYNYERYELLDRDEYDFDKVSALSQNSETKLVVVGHSMGGFLARYMSTLKETEPYLDSIKSFVTLSSPHQLPVLTHDSKLNQLYQETNKLFGSITETSLKLNKNPLLYNQMFDIFTGEISSNNSVIIETIKNTNKELEILNKLNSMVVVSVTGGKRDNTIPTRYTNLNGLHSLQLSTNIDNVRRLGVKHLDHISITWCHKFLSSLAHGIIHALIPNYRERSSVVASKPPETDFSDDLSNDERNKLNKICYDIATFAPNEDCEEALAELHSISLHNYEAITALLTYDKHIGFQVETEEKFVHFFKDIKDVFITITPSYIVLILIFGLLSKLYKTQNLFNPGDHLTIVFKSGVITKVLVAVGLSVLNGYVEVDTDRTLGFFSLSERIVIYLGLCSFINLSSYFQAATAIISESIVSFIPISLKKQAINGFSIIAFSVGGYIGFLFYQTVFETLSVTISLVSALAFVLVTLVATLVVFLVGQLIFNTNFLGFITNMLAIVSLIAVVGPLTNLFQFFWYSSNLEDHLTGLFPHSTVDSEVFGPVKRIQATIPNIQEMQQIIFSVHKMNLKNDFLQMEIEDFAVVGLLAPIVVYFVIYHLQYQDLGNKTVTKVAGAWKQATIEGKNKKKKSRPLKFNFKDDSFIVEGEVIEAKNILNSHLNVIKSSKTKAEIILTNDTEYIDESNIVQTSNKEKVQLDTVKKKKKNKKNKNAIPLFKEGRDIRYRKIEFTTINYKHPVELIRGQGKEVACAVLETMAVILFFWGPTNTWIVLPMTSLVFCAMLLVRLLYSEELASKKIYTKIEYKS